MPRLTMQKRPNQGNGGKATTAKLIEEVNHRQVNRSELTAVRVRHKEGQDEVIFRWD